MKKVLIISYAFPPMGVVGIYRPVKFCKFLPEFGWEPVVLTVRKKFHNTSEQALKREVEQSIKVYRCRDVEPLAFLDELWNLSRDRKNLVNFGKLRKAENVLRSVWSNSILNAIRIIDLLSIPDRFNCWIPSSVYTGLRAIREEQIDLVLSTSPPPSGHLVGYFLSLLTGLPLVIDYRDPWAIPERYESRKLSKMYLVINRFLEKRVVWRSKAIINAHRSFSKMMEVENPFKRQDKFYTITNGLDEDDFNNLKLPVRKNSRFTMLHLGSLYGNRDPGFFFKAVSLWVQRRPEVTENVFIHFIGASGEKEIWVKSQMLGGVVTLTEYMPQLEALPRLWEADLLLLFLGFQRRFSGLLQAKFFEYIATGRPILAFVPPGEAERIIVKYERGLAVTSPDIEKTCEFLDMQYEKWRASGPIRRSEFFLPPEFNRRDQVKDLAGILSIAYRMR